jgi:hypothetical protein
MRLRCTRALLVVGTIACLAGITYVSTPVVRNYCKTVFFESGGEEEEEEEGEKETGIGKQMEMIWQAQAYPDPTNANGKYWQAWQHFQAMRTEVRPPSSGAARVEYGAWAPIGPSNSPGGRILSVAIHPTNTNIVFAGSASGGIWKSTNGATSWSYLPVNLPVLGVPSIIISTANTNNMYAGTGEVYRVDTSNFGYNVWKARGSYGIGVIKSTDGGTTWTQSLVKTNGTLSGIQKLRFDPNNDNIIYACATDGLFRSTDAGVTWSNIATGFKYIADVAINSTNTAQILISVGNLSNGGKGIYRTVNGGVASPTWTKLTTGLPASYPGMIKFTYLPGPTTGQTIYAGIGMGAGNEIYRTTNFGTAWTALNTSGFASYQYWCTVAMQINPAKPDTLIVGGVDLFRYRAGTQARTTITGGVHADMHDIEFDPITNNTIYVACDGGVWKSTNGGAAFAERNTGLSATQFYASFGVSTISPDIFVGGLQDNGVWQYNGGTWTKRTGGDGGPCAFVPGTTTVFGSLDARDVMRNTANGGGAFTLVTSGTTWRSDADSRTAFTAPLAVGSLASNTVYIGTDNLHKSTTGGAAGSFSNDNYATATNYISARHKTAITMAVSKTANPANKVYVSVSPFAQYDNDVDTLYVNQPTDFLRTTTGATPFTSRKPGLPDRFVNDIALKNTNDDSVMVVLGGYGTSHIWLSGNGGATWINRGTDPILPDVPFNAVIFDPNTPGTVYAACDFGVYVSNNNGQKWYDFNGGFQDATMVFDLQVTSDNKLVAATHGKGAWLSPLANSATLPANLLDFTGEQKNNYNALAWKVSEEKQVLRYEVERRIDNGSFAKVADVTARNITGILTYTYNDNVAGISGTNYYYRIKIVNADGSTNYSNVILIKIVRSGNLLVLGNPVTNSSAIQLNLANPTLVTFKMYDAKGSLIAVNRVNALAGANRYSFSMFGVLARGHYVLEAITTQERFSKRIIVQ